MPKEQDHSSENPLMWVEVGSAAVYDLEALPKVADPDIWESLFQNVITNTVVFRGYLMGRLKQGEVDENWINATSKYLGHLWAGLLENSADVPQEEPQKGEGEKKVFTREEVKDILRGMIQLPRDLRDIDEARTFQNKALAAAVNSVFDKKTPNTLSDPDIGNLRFLAVELAQQNGKPTIDSRAQESILTTIIRWLDSNPVEERKGKPLEESMKVINEIINIIEKGAISLSSESIPYIINELDFIRKSHPPAVRTRISALIHLLSLSAGVNKWEELGAKEQAEEESSQQS